jgi:hypothetical protein
MTLILPGTQGQRQRAASPYLFDFRSADGTLETRTGQLGVLTAHASNVGSVTGLNGAAFNVGRGQPRFTAINDATTRLRLQGEVDGTLNEGVTFPFGGLVQTLTIYLKLRSMYTLAGGGIASPGAGAIMLGNATSLGGYLLLGRVTAGVWRATRGKGGSLVAISATAETGSWVHPFEFLLSQNANGSVTLTIRDCSGVTRATVTSPTDASMIVLTDTWAGGVLTLCRPVVQSVISKGGEFDYEVVQVLRGIKTYADFGV